MNKEELIELKTTEDAIGYLNRLIDKDGELTGFIIERDDRDQCYRASLVPMCVYLDSGIGATPKEAIMDVINKYYGRPVYF